MSPPPSTEQLRKLGYPMTTAGGVQLPPSPRMSRTPAPLADQFEALFAMTARQRVTAMYRGELTLTQLSKWAARHPDQVAVVNDEWIYLVALLADVADATHKRPRAA